MASPQTNHVSPHILNILYVKQRGKVPMSVSGIPCGWNTLHARIMCFCLLESNVPGKPESKGYYRKKLMISTISLPLPPRIQSFFVRTRLRENDDPRPKGCTLLDELLHRGIPGWQPNLVVGTLSFEKTSASNVNEVYLLHGTSVDTGWFPIQASQYWYWYWSR